MAINEVSTGANNTKNEEMHEVKEIKYVRGKIPDFFKISLFGHRDFSEHVSMERGLMKLLAELLNDRELVEIYIGRNGEFDVFSASIIKRFQKKTDDKKCEMTLVLPYAVRDVDDFQKYYDNVTIPIKAHPKAAITLRNKWMIENSDLVLVYVVNSHGGAYEAMRYAEKLNKKVINLAKFYCE